MKLYYIIYYSYRYVEFVSTKLFTIKYLKLLCLKFRNVLLLFVESKVQTYYFITPEIYCRQYFTLQFSSVLREK